ncbi:MAG: hypothetical protein ACKORJ_03680, partial [Bacteroidota bacterium]
MKKYLFLTMALVTLASTAWSQEPDGPPPTGKARERIEAARAAVITERLGLTPDQAEKFWPIYHEFANRRQE